MISKKMKLVMAAAGLTAVLAMTGCGGSSEKAKSGDAAKGGIPPVIRVGSETTFPPFEFTEGDKYVGFDLDLASAVAKQMGSKISNNEIDLLIFLQDPSNKKRTPDFYNVLNLCDQYNIPCATNLPTAEVLILALDRGDLDWRNMYK